MSDLKNKILESIKNGKVTMRPRWHFVLRAVLLIFGATIAFLALLFFVSFTIFALWRTGAWYVSAFGMRGVLRFLLAVPWVLVWVSLAFVVVLEILAAKYSFAHRKPLLYSVLGIVGVAVIGGFVVAKTTFHPWLHRRAAEHQLPFAGALYERFSMRDQDMIHRGQVMELVEGGFILDPFRGETSTVFILPETRLPYGFDFAAGDTVVVFGERNGTIIRAAGIQEIDADDIDRFRMRQGGPGTFYGEPRETNRGFRIIPESQ